MSTIHQFAENARRISLSSADANLLFSCLPDAVIKEIMVDERVRAQDRRFAEGCGPFVSAKPKRRASLARAETSNWNQQIADDWRRGTEALASIPAEKYLAILSPDSEPHRGKCRCPWPGHEDVHPSATYKDVRFYCHVCGEGGGVFQLGAAISGLGDRGDQFGDLRRWIAERMLGATS